MGSPSNGLRFAAKNSLTIQSEQRERGVRKQCDLVPSRVFCSASFRPRAKMLVGKLPKPFSKLHPPDAGCAFLRNASIPVQTKNTPKADAKSTFGVFRLPARIPVPLRCLFCEESFDIFLCPQKPLHFLPGLAVFRVSCLLPLEQLGILGV